MQIPYLCIRCQTQILLCGEKKSAFNSFLGDCYAYYSLKTTVPVFHSTDWEHKIDKTLLNESE